MVSHRGTMRPPGGACGDSIFAGVKMRGFIGLLVAGFWLCLPTSGTAQNYAPRNECAEIEGADEFRMQLAMAIANRNTAMLMPLVSEDVLLDFGGGRGLTELRKRLDHPNYLLGKSWSSCKHSAAARAMGRSIYRGTGARI